MKDFKVNEGESDATFRVAVLLAFILIIVAAATWGIIAAALVTVVFFLGNICMNGIDGNIPYRWWKEEDEKDEPK